MTMYLSSIVMHSSMVMLLMCTYTYALPTDSGGRFAALTYIIIIIEHHYMVMPINLQQKETLGF